MQCRKLIQSSSSIFILTWPNITQVVKDLTAEELKKRWEEYTKELYQKKPKDFNDSDKNDDVVTHLETDILDCEVKQALRNHSYKQSYWRWWNSSWAISNPKTWCCESATLNMPANLENSAVATGLANVSFHSNPKWCQYQMMFKLSYNCTHFIC